MEPYIFTVHYEQQDIIEFTWAGKKSKKEPRRLGKLPMVWQTVFYGVIFVVCCVLLAMDLEWKRPVWYALVALTIVDGFLLLVRCLFYYVGLKARREALQNLVNMPDVNVTVDETGIRDVRVDGAKETFWAWSLFTYVTVTPGLYLLTIEGKQQLILPKRCMADGVERMEAYVTAMLADKGVEVYRPDRDALGRKHNTK